MSSKAAPTLLVVEDEADLLEVLQEVLADAGYRVAVARSGEDALAALARLPVSAVVTDLRMPILSGRDLVQTIRTDPALRSLPVLIMTGGDRDAERFADQQACLLLRKPFDMDVFLHVVGQLVPRAAS